MMKNKYFGFTVVELLIVIVIIGILAVVASSLYRNYVFKGRRGDGISAILSLQLLEENYRSNNTNYGSIAQIGGSAASPQGYYALTVSNVGSSSYTITATAQGNQANDSEGGTACTTLTLTANNGTVTQTPTACWPQ